MTTGFALVDGDAAGGARGATPRHWLIAVCIVLAAQAVLDYVISATQYFAVLAMGGGVLSAFGATHSGVIAATTVIPFGILAALTLYLSVRVDGRGAEALGLTRRALGGSVIWVLVGLIAAIPNVAAHAAALATWDQAADALATLVPITIVQAAAEEILFRGVILTMLVARYGARAGLFMSAGAFALWHVYAGQGFVDFVIVSSTTFVFGLTSGLLALRQGHLGGAIALHVVWNVAAGLAAGLDHWPAAFWESFAASYYAPWTMEAVNDRAALNSVLASLLIETVFVLALCRATILGIFAPRAPASA